MKLTEAAVLLGCSKKEVEKMIATGVKLPGIEETVILQCDTISDESYITDESFDEFVDLFEKYQPGRHPPVSVRRSLLVEANHACAICRNIAPLQYHHMVEWSKVKHHDPRYMLAVCGTCVSARWSHEGRDGEGFGEGLGGYPFTPRLGGGQ